MTYGELEKLYQRAESFECKGLCQIYCGPVMFSQTEKDKIGGVRPPTQEQGEKLRCSYLTGMGTCEIYEHRPLICRLFGAVDDKLMRCPHGCKPTLTRQEGDDIIWQYGQILKREAKAK